MFSTRMDLSDELIQEFLGESQGSLPDLDQRPKEFAFKLRNFMWRKSQETGTEIGKVNQET